MINLSDYEIIKLVTSGNKEAYAVLIDRYKEMSFRIAIKYMKNREDTEEIVQDAFIKAYKSLGKFNYKAKFSTWLYRIIINTCISQLRKHRIDATEINENQAGKYDFYDINNALKQFRLEDQQRVVDALMEHLNQEESMLIRLFYMDDLSINEISEICSLSASNLKVKLFRARKKMHGLLSESLKSELLEI